MKTPTEHNMSYPEACRLRRVVLDAQARAYHEAPLLREIERRYKAMFSNLKSK